MSDADKEVFYGEQIEIAYSDGAVGATARTALPRVRERIGLSAADALRVEERVLGVA